MDYDGCRTPVQAEINRVLLPRFATPSAVAFEDADGSPPSAEPLLLPPANPAYNRELPYDEQDIDGYTIAEAHAALEAFKRNRNRKT
ncbi:MAG: hypothetical protein ETSY2_50155 [Candidatus Entotheonella gemina]|uniref:Uncharacterized protein n=1 Tax=Candidatus Entotheonella gemina TaxID=1429439 RepID=W4L806_9BACT|nr:MAG: hypothetical protein ETSY2_50155 [Candidatus Entotheonella gemina]